MERNRLWSSCSNLTLPLSEEGLYSVVEGAVYSKVEFASGATLKDWYATSVPTPNTINGPRSSQVVLTG